MEFVSLSAIIYDLLNIIRGAKITDDEPISEKQIESWIHQYRSLFLKRDLDKGKYPNPDYIQTIDDIELEYDDDMKMFRTNIVIPSTIDLNNKSGLVYVGDTYGNQIQLVPESRINWQQYKRATQDNALSFLRNKRIYLHNPKALNNVSIKGIFQVPGDAAIANGDTYSYDSYYPIPMNVIPSLKQEILRNELNIEWKAPSDNTNDANHKLEN